MWDKIKEYFTVIFAQGFWWGGKAKGHMEWMEENKTALYIIVGIIVVVLVLVYMRPYAAIASKTKR
jgi:hypothetical protein